MSGRAVPLALGLLAAALAGVVAIEARTGAARRPLPSRSAAQTVAPSPGLPSPDLAQQRISGYVADILARPLVSPNRRPGTAVAIEAFGLPRLTGVMISAAGKVAIFAGPSPGAKPLAVGEGEKVGPYLIAAIGSDGVTIVGPQGAGPPGGRLLRPAFDSNAPIARPPHAPAGK